MGLNRSCVVVLGVIASLVPGLSAAQTAAKQPESRSKAEYVDKLIDDGNLEQITQSEDDSKASTKGNPRSLVVELVGVRIQPSSSISGVDTSALDKVQQEAGLSISGRYQTNSWGTLGVDLQLRHGTSQGSFIASASSGLRGSATLSDRDLPLGQGWTADNLLGTFITPQIPLLRQQQRFFIPVPPILGASSTLKHYRPLSNQQVSTRPKPHASFNLSVGEPGLFGGLRLGEFSELSGVALSGGGQVSISSHLAAGVQLIGINDARDPYSLLSYAPPDQIASTRISSRSALAVISYRAPGFQADLNAISSHSKIDSVNLRGDHTDEAHGIWMDFNLRTTKSNQSAGLYYLEPNLVWGTSALVSNAYGGYYRYSLSSQRWRMSVNFDATQSVDGRSLSGVLASGDLRRQVSFSTAIGINSSIRRSAGETSWRTLSYVDLSTWLGQTKIETGYSHNSSLETFRIGWSQNWSLPATLPPSSRFSTFASFDLRNPTAQARQFANSETLLEGHSFNIGVSAGGSPMRRLNLDLNLTYSTSNSSTGLTLYGPGDQANGSTGGLFSQSGRGISATLSGTYRFSQSWTLSATYVDTRSDLSSRYGLINQSQSPIGYSQAQFLDLQKNSFRLQAGYVTLRYSISAGRTPQVNGRSAYPVGGAGSLGGVVFLDRNGNGRQDPGEFGVAGIIVILDGIQGVSTDDTGAYQFDNVAEGDHVVTVNSDALPLPWTISSGSAQASNGSYSANVYVGVRTNKRLNIAASRS